MSHRTVYQCDRCKVDDLTDINDITLPKTIGRATLCDLTKPEYVELCDQCAISYRKWFRFETKP